MCPGRAGGRDAGTPGRRGPAAGTPNGRDAKRPGRPCLAAPAGSSDMFKSRALRDHAVRRVVIVTRVIRAPNVRHAPVTFGTIGVTIAVDCHNQFARVTHRATAEHNRHHIRNRTCDPEREPAQRTATRPPRHPVHHVPIHARRTRHGHVHPKPEHTDTYPVWCSPRADIFHINPHCPKHGRDHHRMMAPPHPIIQRPGSYPVWHHATTARNFRPPGFQCRACRYARGRRNS